MKYLKEQYKLFESEINDIIKKCQIFDIKKYNIDDNGYITVYDNVGLNDKNLKSIPLKFKEVFGYFDCSENYIDNLYGCPKIVHDDFDFSYNNIVNLKYCPMEIGGGLYCDRNINLKEFIDFPNHIAGNVYFSYCSIENLYKCTNIINGTFNISHNKNLKDLSYGPKTVNGDYNVSHCNLISLNGSANHIENDFICNNNRLKSLLYSPKYIGGNFIFYSNKIASFLHFPEYVGGDIICDGNPIYNVWKLFKDKNMINYFNQMKIIKNDKKIILKRLNIFLKSIGKNTVNFVSDYYNI